MQKKTCNYLIVFLIAVLAFPASARLKRVYRFRNVKLPYTLKVENKIIKNGFYHFDFWHNSNMDKYYLRITKKKKALCMIPGTQLKYKSHGKMMLHDPDIPKHPQMQIKRNPRNSQIYLIFESGKKTCICPGVKVRYDFECINE